ncbi:choice-of-anchor J domain-containing protein [Weeksellaceae bacterium TAE3-ERU29]|nr:choice-of-anchor J domain-containing protein [Weeksellaceae bacterium TAE3-ERU29]
MNKLSIFLLLIFSVFSFAQTIVVQEDFKDGLPDEWEVKTDHKYKKWKAKSYKDYHYITMSAFSGRNKPIEEIKTYLYTPVISKEERGCKLKFSFADAYSNGNPLEVFLVDEDKKLIKSINEKFYVELINNDSKYDNNFESTEWIDLPNVGKDYHIAFRYNSKGKISTTIQLDAVDIWCE